MDYPFLSKFWMFIAKKYSTFNEFIFFSEYSVLLMMLLKCKFSGLHYYTLSQTMIACMAMQLRFFKHGTLLNSVFKIIHNCRHYISQQSLPAADYYIFFKYGLVWSFLLTSHQNDFILSVGLLKFCEFLIHTFQESIGKLPIITDRFPMSLQRRSVEIAPSLPCLRNSSAPSRVRTLSRETTSQTSGSTSYRRYIKLRVSLTYCERRPHIYS